MTTPEEIENLLNEFGGTLKGLPIPGEQLYAYERKDRITAFQMAKKWQGNHYDIFNPECAEEDFICHQSDVIELLIQALYTARRKYEGNKIN